MHHPEFLDALCSTGDGVFVVDASQHVVRWNSGAERILGYTEADAFSRPCHQLIAGMVRPDKPWCQPGCKVQSCAHSHTPLENFDLLTRSKGGEQLWLNISIISPPDGGNPLSAHVVRDVTREKLAGEVIEKFLSMLGNYGLIRERAGERRYKPPAAARTSAPDARNVLSSREIEVLTLLAEGLSTKVVSERLVISRYTARNHIQNILTKLDLHSKAQAVSYAFKHGLL